MWLSIGIDYQYQSIDKLVSIGCRLTKPDSTHKKHNFVRNKMPAILALRVMLGLIHLFQLYASPIDKTILANGIV